MPTYEYECNTCKEEFELRRKRKDPSPVVCPACGKEDCKKLISASSFHLKGGGWYDEGYGLQSGSTKSAKKKDSVEKDSVEKDSGKKAPKGEKSTDSGSDKSSEKSENKNTKTKEKPASKSAPKSKTKSEK